MVAVLRHLRRRRGADRRRVVGAARRGDARVGPPQRRRTCPGAPTWRTTLAPELRDGDIVITLGAGDVWMVGEEILQAARDVTSDETSARRGARRRRRAALRRADERATPRCASAARSTPGSRPARSPRSARCAPPAPRAASVSRAFGSGSNLLVRDGGMRGVAVSLEKLREVRIERRTGEGAALWVDAGASTGKLLAFATRENLGGVEFLGGVPGTVGGGMIMNAGTYLGEFKDVTFEVARRRRAGRAVVRDNAGCGFRYRHSDDPGRRRGHRRAPARCRRGRARRSKPAVRELRERRKAREPHGVPNAGSIFKNPPERLRRAADRGVRPQGPARRRRRGLAGARQLAGQRRRRDARRICSRWWRSCAPRS